MSLVDEPWYEEVLYPNWDHQDRELELHRDEKARALHWQMRTGKSKAMLDLASYHRLVTGRIDGLLIAAPNNVHLNWVRKELAKHLWLGVDYSALAWDSEANRTDRDYKRALGDLMQFPGLAVFAMNAEGFALTKQRAAVRRFVKARRFLLVTDETHEWRRPGSKRSTFTRTHVAPHAEIRRNLSGTMVLNSPFHAWSQYELLERAALGFEDYKAFEQRYGEWDKETIYVRRRDKPPVQRTVPVLKQHRHMEELQASMERLTSYVYRDQCDDLPTLVESQWPFQLNADQKRIYNQVASGALTRLEDGTLLGEADGAAMITALQQVSSGYFRDEDGDLAEIVPVDECPRLRALGEIFEQTEGKLVVWCRYRTEIVRVLEYLRGKGYDVVDYYGGTKRKDRPVNEDRFQNDPSVKGLVGQPKACGQGLDFSAGEHMVWFSHLHGDLITKAQADERCTAMGGRSIAVTSLVARGTVDEKILMDNEDKAEVADFLTGDGMRRYLELLP